MDGDNEDDEMLALEMLTAKSRNGFLKSWHSSRRSGSWHAPDQVEENSQNRRAEMGAAADVERGRLAKNL